MSKTLFVNSKAALTVTTSVKPSPAIEAQAQQIAAELAAPYLPRLARSLPDLFAASESARMLIVGADHLRLRDRATETEYFFHPNMFQVRASNVLRGAPDHFLEATGLKAGDHLLDCTLGFASEASLAALVVGETGSVTGLESVLELAVITRIGLQTFSMQSRQMEAALRRVRVLTADYRNYLQTCAENMFDVVYFDPFFDQRLPGSEPSVSPLHLFGNPSPLDMQGVIHACRVARRRVVIKRPRHAPLPTMLADKITATIGSRKSRIVYSVIERR